MNGSYSEPGVLFSVSQLALFEVPPCHVPGKMLSTEDSNLDKREMFATHGLLYTYYSSYCIIGEKVTHQFQHKHLREIVLEGSTECCESLEHLTLTWEVREDCHEERSRELAERKMTETYLREFGGCSLYL